MYSPMKITDNSCDYFSICTNIDVIVQIHKGKCYPDWTVDFFTESLFLL